MMKIFDRVSKIFFAFICFIVILGMIFLSIRNYTTPVVSYASLVPVDKIKSTYYFNGTVLPKETNVVEIKAAQDMDISKINIKNDQIIPDNENLFTIDINTATLDKISTQDDYNDKLYSANVELNSLLKNLGKKLNKEIKNINDINPDDGITILAPSNGKVKNLSIEKGKKIISGTISNIIDDSMLKISFKMTANEYPSMSVGQNVLVSFSGYEGYYKAKITSINPNAEPDKDKISFIYNGVIEVKNPGLIYPGINAGISIENNGQPVSTLSNAGVVESYAEQLPVTTEMYSNYNRDAYATEVYVVENESVKEGQKIAKISGNDVINELKNDIKNINDKMKLITEIYRDMNTLYGDVIYSNMDHKFTIDVNGNCTVPEKVYIDYVTDKSAVRKDDVILRYRTYNTSNLGIKANVDIKTYGMLKGVGDKLYYGKNYSELTSKAVLEFTKEFSKYYELFYVYQESDIGKLLLNDSVTFKFEAEDKYTNVIPKTAIIPIGRIAVGASCYVYVINTEDSILGKIDVLDERKATITAVGDDKVSLEFEENYFGGNREVYVVNYINSTLKDGMRVKTRWKNY